MSINDLMNDDSLLLYMGIIFIIIMIIALPAGIAAGKKATNNIYGDDGNEEKITEEVAKVVARRTVPHPMNQTVMINMIVFEMKNGERIELAIKDANTYGTIVEGDTGILWYQGKKFIDFERGTNDEI